MQRCKAHIWNSNSWVHKLLEESSIRRKVSIFILFTISTNFFPHPSKMCVLYFDWCARNTDWFCPLFWQGLKITLIKNFPRDFYYIMILKFPFHFTGSQLNVRQIDIIEITLKYLTRIYRVTSAVTAVLSHDLLDIFIFTFCRVCLLLERERPRIGQRKLSRGPGTILHESNRGFYTMHD